jgi:hypothetical protein
MHERLTDALYNTMPVLEKYKKLQEEPLNEEQLAAFKNKMNNFIDITKNW